MWNVESFGIVHLSLEKSFFLGIMLDAPVALSEPVHEPEPLLCCLWAGCCELQIHLQVCLQFPHVWWHFLTLLCFETLAGLVLDFGLSKQMRSLGSGCSIPSYLGLRGTSVSHGEGACLSPGKFLSPWLQPWAGISGLQRLQTIMSSPGIISLLEIDAYSN